MDHLNRFDAPRPESRIQPPDNLVFEPLKFIAHSGMGRSDARPLVGNGKQLRLFGKERTCRLPPRPSQHLRRKLSHRQIHLLQQRSKDRIHRAGVGLRSQHLLRPEPIRKRLPPLPLPAGNLPDSPQRTIRKTDLMEQGRPRAFPFRLLRHRRKRTGRGRTPVRIHQ